jgi:hypothetical protein
MAEREQHPIREALKDFGTIAFVLAGIALLGTGLEFLDA